MMTSAVIDFSSCWAPIVRASVIRLSISLGLPCENPVTELICDRINHAFRTACLLQLEENIILYFTVLQAFEFIMYS